MVCTCAYVDSSNLTTTFLPFTEMKCMLKITQTLSNKGVDENTTKMHQYVINI